MNRTQQVKSKKFLTTIVIMVCLFTASVFMYKTVIDKIADNKDATIESFKEEQFRVVWTSLENFQLEALAQVTDISSKIEKDILALSDKDFNQLQEDMTNNVLNEDLHEILNSNIVGVTLNGINNHANGMVIMTIDGYIEDFNYRRAQASGDGYLRPWQSQIDNSYNKELERDAIDKLINRTTGIIALESYDIAKNDNHIKLTELTYDSLLEVYLKEGISGLKNYQIFVPYYITDDGDIFGTPDISHGTMVDNNKLIVVQEFNLYDQIINNHGDVFDKGELKDLEGRYNDLLRLLYILGIMLITSVIGLVMYLCNVYNKLLYTELSELDSQDEVDGNSKNLLTGGINEDK